MVGIEKAKPNMVVGGGNQTGSDRPKTRN